ncbi:MAG: TonB-dependent receptor [Paludibacter sp.]
MKNTPNPKILKGKLSRSLCLFLLLFINVFLSNCFAQNATLTIQQKNISVKEVLSIIEKNSQIVFFYADKDIDLNRKVNLDIKNQTLTKTLEELFKNSLNNFKIDGKQVYISKKAKLVDEKVKQATIKSKVSGIVTDERNETVIGANIILNGTKIATITDINGRFSIDAPEDGELKISYIGYETQTVDIKGKLMLSISLSKTLQKLDEVVVVGYGSQKKQSVVGAITQTKGTDLVRTGVFSSVGQALTGLLPGVTTQTVTGMPGAEDPKILIRGLSSWNGSDPLVLIDGVERKMSDIEMGQIDAISVLKDASATAVFGVKGAEGVILITTKRGKEGKAQITFSTNSTFKYISKLPINMDSYETFAYQNETLERQNPAFSTNWSWYLPQGILNKYRNPTSVYESELYPNVNWAKEVAKSNAMTNRYDLNITGGTTFAKYFAALSYLKDDDLLKTGLDVGLPYKAKWGFERYNFRSNLDFNISKTTVLSVNLAGAISKKDGFSSNATNIWRAFYQLSPSNFPVRWEDGTFGYNPNNTDINPVAVLSGSAGLSTDYTTQIFTDFSLKQDLGFITKGLTAQGSLSYDNRMYSGSAISAITLLSKSISREGVITYNPSTGGSDFDYFKFPGSFDTESFSIGSTQRRLYYKGQLNYSRSFGKHDVSALALMSREEFTAGSEFPHYREDWVGRVTYGFDDRYFVEMNGAYNGSEKFAAKYRFGFFPSLGLGWMLSNESFFKQKWLDKLKIRYSIGTVGSDNFASQRWAYDSQWGLDGSDITTFGTTYTNGDIRTGPGATYKQYRQLVLGNPELQWEISKKQNIGLDFSIFKSTLSGSFELFQDDRSNVFMSAAQRAAITPSYFGAAPVAANIGKVQNKGFEMELKLQQTWSGVHCWIGYNFTHSEDKVIFRDDPELMFAYQKNEGFQIGQPRYQIEQPGFTKSWDDLYGTVAFTANSGRLPGSVAVVDFNGDGVIDAKDNAAYGYPNRPQNTYNASFGVDYKGFSFMVQFFGVYNVSQYFNNINFTADSRSPWANSLLGDYWSPTNLNASYPMLPAGGSAFGQNQLTRGRVFDASYLRLKNMEIAYTFSGKLLKSLSLNALKLTLSGNNLLFFSNIPEDRESAVDIYAQGEQSFSLYPTVKRINFGLNVTF